jgi:hypothetical protein
VFITNFFIRHVYMEATPEIIALMDKYEKKFHSGDNLTKHELLLRIHRKRIDSESQELYRRPNMAGFVKLSDFARQKLNAVVKK